MSDTWSGQNIGHSQSEFISSVESDFFGTQTPGLHENHVIAIRQLVQAYLLANKIVDDAVNSIGEQQSQGYWMKLTGDMGNLYRLACSVAKTALGATPWREGNYEKSIDMLIKALSSQYLQKNSQEVLSIKEEYEELIKTNSFDLTDEKNSILIESSKNLLFNKKN